MKTSHIIDLNVKNKSAYLWKAALAKWNISMPLLGLLHSFETFHDNHADNQQEYVKLYGLLHSTVSNHWASYTQTWGNCFVLLCF